VSLCCITASFIMVLGLVSFRECVALILVLFLHGSPIVELVDGSSRAVIVSCTCVCTLEGATLDVQLNLVFRNDSDKPLECVFRSHEDGVASVYAFAVQINGRHIASSVCERSKARNLFDDALSRGANAALVEEANEGHSFAISCGLLRAHGEECHVSLSYTKLCPFAAQHELLVVIPYTALRPLQPVQCRVNIVGVPSEPRCNQSGMHISSSGRDSWTINSIGDQSCEPLAIYVARSPAMIPFTVSAERFENTVALMAMPSLSAPGLLEDVNGASSLIFLIDRSGSMNGSNMRFSKL
jgi:hypothetical protein